MEQTPRAVISPWRWIKWVLILVAIPLLTIAAYSEYIRLGNGYLVGSARYRATQTDGIEIDHKSTLAFSIASNGTFKDLRLRGGTSPVKWEGVIEFEGGKTVRAKFSSIFKEWEDMDLERLPWDSVEAERTILVNREVLDDLSGPEDRAYAVRCTGNYGVVHFVIADISEFPESGEVSIIVH